jgi:hypothetical protein
MSKIGPFTKQDDMGNQIFLHIIPFSLHQWPKFLFAKRALKSTLSLPSSHLVFDELFMLAHLICALDCGVAHWISTNVGNVCVQSSSFFLSLFIVFVF